MLGNTSNFLRTVFNGDKMNAILLILFYKRVYISDSTGGIPRIIKKIFKTKLVLNSCDSLL